MYSKKKRNRRRNNHRRISRKKVGFIGRDAHEIFIDLYELNGQKPQEIIWIIDDVCVDCLKAFIMDNKLSTLFIAPHVTICESPISKYITELEEINAITDCNIFFAIPKD